MFEIISSGGWLMLPIILCSIIAIAIIAERFYALQTKKIVTPKLADSVWQLVQKGDISLARIETVRRTSPLGEVLASGLTNLNQPREVMKESLEETGRRVTAELQRFLNTLGTIAQITPLLGLLGTVTGMITVFTVITSAGVGDPADLAGGISQALITTAAGLTVAIPSLIFLRYFRGKVDQLVINMEEEALKLVDYVHSPRPQAAVKRARSQAAQQV